MDGLIDYPNDPECLTLGDTFEMPSCNNYDIAGVVSGEGGSYEFSPVDDFEGIEVSCGFSAGQEAVYAIYVDEISKVTVSVTDSPDNFSSTYVALRSECDLEETELGCFTSSSPGPRAFNNVAPGLYFLIIHRTEFSSADPFTVDITVDTQECADGIDNDGDGAIDSDDVGCASEIDLIESTDAEPDFELPECSDGLDNDMDGQIDYPNDDLCIFAGGEAEGPSCSLYNEEMEIVTESANFMVDTTGGENNYTRATSANGPEVPFVLILSETSDVTIDLTSGHDTYLHMRSTDCDDASATYDYNDDRDFGELDSLLSLTAVPEGIYYVFVDGFSLSNSGVVTVDVQITATP